MAVKKRGLGRGLDALLSSASANTSQNQQEETQLREISIRKIQPGQYQPRRDMDQHALEELASSIKAQGIMQPIVVRSVGASKYEIIAGERRWRAASLLDLATVPVIVRQVDDEAAIAMALIENIQREDLNPLEEALALQRLQQQYELTQQQLADAVGKSRSTVTNLLRLVSLPEEVKTMLNHGDLEMGHARALLALNGSEQTLAARHVVAMGLNVRQTEAYVRKLQQPAARAKAERDPDIGRLEQHLEEKLGTRVQIREQGKGKGQLVIKYTSLEQLQGVLEYLR